MKRTIRELRERLGYTQEELGKRFKKPKAPETICRWERGEAIPNGKNLLELASILGVSADEILID